MVDGTLNRFRYVDLLSKRLVPYLKEVDEKCHGVVFQDDNAPCHASKYTARWRGTHSISRMPWPAQSPDLNPMEHLWDHLDRQIRKRRPLPTSLPGLAAALRDEWGKIPLDVVGNLISSMPNRTAAVIRARGKNTPY